MTEIDGRFPRAVLWLIAGRNLVMIVGTYDGKLVKDREIPIPAALKKPFEIRVWAKATALLYAKVNNIPERLVFEDKDFNNPF